MPHPRYLQLGCLSPESVRAANLDGEINSLLCLCVRLALPCRDDMMGYAGHGNDVLEFEEFGEQGGIIILLSECLGIWPSYHVKAQLLAGIYTVASSADARDGSSRVYCTKRIIPD